MSKVENNEVTKELSEFLLNFSQITEYESEYGSGKGGLAFLKDFYTQVWGSYEEYVENDVFLYELFKGEKDGQCNIVEARVAILDSMYGTQVKKISKIIKIAKEFKDIISALKENEACKNKKDKPEKYVEGLRLEISFFSKYFHWYNEVNNKGKALPIYDTNVRMVLNSYLDEDNKKLLGNKYTKSYDEVKIAVDKFIKEIGINEEYKKNPIEIENTKLTQDLKKVSLYRLVDKFLWLSYKIYKYKNANDKEKEGLGKVAEKYKGFIENLKSLNNEQ